MYSRDDGLLTSDFRHPSLNEMPRRNSVASDSHSTVPLFRCQRDRGAFVSAESCDDFLG